MDGNGWTREPRRARGAGTVLLKRIRQVGWSIGPPRPTANLYPGPLGARYRHRQGAGDGRARERGHHGALRPEARGGVAQGGGGATLPVHAPAPATSLPVSYWQARDALARLGEFRALLLDLGRAYSDRASGGISSPVANRTRKRMARLSAAVQEDLEHVGMGRCCTPTPCSSGGRSTRTPSPTSR